MQDNQTFDNVFFNFPLPALIILPDTPVFTVIDANRAYLKMIDVTSGEILNKGFFEYFKKFDGQDMTDDARSLEEALSTKETQNTAIHGYEFFTSGNENPKIRYFYASNEPVLNDDGNVNYFIHTVTDVTDTVSIRKKQKRTKKDLLETALMMSQGQELANFGTWQWNVVKNKVTWSETLYTIYGLDKNSFKATFEGYLELLHPSDRERVTGIITGLLVSKGDAVFEERIFRPNGDMRYLKSWGKVQTDENGAPVKMIGACLDITDSKIAEQNLQQMHRELEGNLKVLAASEKRYSDLFHLSPLPMWVFDLDRKKFTEVNAAAIAHYGYSLDEFLTMDVTDIWPAECIADFEETVNASKQVYNGVSTHTKKNGEQIKAYLQSNFIEFTGQNMHLVLATDITERQNYIQAIEEKNRHLREIAWIQSHVVRAPLARIMGLVELFKTYKQDEIDNEDLLEKIFISANELDEIVRSISDKTGDIL